MKRWTQKEVDFLKKNYQTKLDKNLSKILGKSVKAINWQAYKLRLKKDYNFYCKSRKKYKKEFTKEIFKDLYLIKKKSIREISSILKLGKNTVDYYLKKYNLPKRSKSEASSLASLKYPPWQKGLNKNNSKKIRLMAKKVKETYLKKRKERIKKIEHKFKMPIKRIIYTFYWNENLTQEKIAKKIGLSRNLIIKLMKDFSINKRPNFEYIISLKGKKHPMYGKTWEDVFGIKKTILRKKEFSIRARKNIIRRLKNKEMPFLNTKIEKKIAKALNKVSIPFIPQYSIDKKFVCDFALPTFNIIIECDGDYWHANPKYYNNDKLDIRQKRNVQRDKFKDRYLSKKCWKIFRFFESDINKSTEKCINKVLKEIKNNLNQLKTPWMICKQIIYFIYIL